MSTDPATLLARCRAALDESDRTAQAAQGTITISPGRVLGDSPRVTASRDFMRANDPARVLALNAALRTVLDGAGRTIAEHLKCSDFDEVAIYPCPDFRRATETVAVLAVALTGGTT